MYISGIEINSYKSFLKSALIEFSPGINLIVGVNNSGKTALLEALTLKIKDKPHLRENKGRNS
jgi:predicted ATP-dependent endonuclease of OLD family